MFSKRPTAPVSAKTKPSGSGSWGCQPPLQILHDALRSDVRNQQHGQNAPIQVDGGSTMKQLVRFRLPIIEGPLWVKSRHPAS